MLLIVILRLWNIIILDKIWRILDLLLFILEINSLSTCRCCWMPVKSVACCLHLIIVVKVVSLTSQIGPSTLFVPQIIRLLSLSVGTFLLDWNILTSPYQRFCIYRRLWFCIGWLSSTNQRWTRDSCTLWSFLDMDTHLWRLSRLL